MKICSDKRRGGLIQLPVPVLVAEGGEQQRSGFAGDAGKGQHDSGDHSRRRGAQRDRQRGAPARNSQSVGRFAHRLGTSSSISSVVRVMVGIIMMASATPPASAEKCFCVSTTRA